MFTLVNGSCPLTAVEWANLETTYCKDGGKYHCIPNENGQLGQVCTSPIWIQPNACPIFNTKTQKMGARLCDSRQPDCQIFHDYRSSRAYEYKACISAKEDTKTIAQSTTTEVQTNNIQSSDVTSGVNTPVWIILIVLLIILSVAAVLVGIFVYRKKMRGQNGNAAGNEPDKEKQEETVHLTAQNPCPDVRIELGITYEIRVVLIGRTGSGKSASGNTLLGSDEFKSSQFSCASITQKCPFKNAKRFGKNLMVVITPGAFDTRESKDEIIREIAESIGISSPGPHAFVLVVQFGKFTKIEQDTVQTFSEIFGEDIYNHMIVLFTRRDETDRQNINIHEYIEKAPAELKALVQKCNGQVFAMNNVQKRKDREKDAENFINLVEEITRKNGGNHYSNRMFEEALRRWRERTEEVKRIQEIAKENEKMQLRKEMDLEYQKKIEDFEKRNRETEAKIREYEEKLGIERAQTEDEKDKDFDQLKYNVREDDIRREERRKIEEEDATGKILDGFKQAAVNVGLGAQISLLGIKAGASTFYEFWSSD